MTSSQPSAALSQEPINLELTAQEQFGLEDKKAKLALVDNAIKEMSYNFIAFLGSKKLEQSINVDQLNTQVEEGLATTADTREGAGAGTGTSAEAGAKKNLTLGIVCFHNIEPVYISNIVKYVLEKQEEARFNGLNPTNADVTANLLQHVEFKLPHSSALKEEFERTAQWLNNSILSNAMLNCIYPYDKDGAYWRNHLLEPGLEGKLIVSIITGATDTTSNITQITSDDLKEVIPELFKEFLNLYFKEHNHVILRLLDRYTIDYKQIEMVLKLLVHNDNFSVDLLELACYVAHFIYLLEQEIIKVEQSAGIETSNDDIEFDNEDDAKVINCGKLLGEALPQLLMPRDEKRFCMRMVSVRKRDYESALSKLYTNCYGLKNRYNSRNNLIDRNSLLSNFALMLNTASAANSDSNDGDNDTMGLEPWESAAIKQYLKGFDNDKSYGETFAFLCNVEWNDKLEHLFALKPTREKKKLSTRTKSLILDKARKENHNKEISLLKLLTKDEIQLIDSIDHKAQLTEDDRHNLYDFFQQHRNYFDQNRTIAKAWQKVIFEEQLAGEDFLFNICKLMLILLSQQQEQTLLGVCFNLDMTTTELNKLNYDVASFFSCRYGPLLLELSTICDQEGNQLFKLLVKGAEVAPEINPMLSYRNYFVAQQQKSRSGLKPSTSEKDECITLKFEVMPLYADNALTTPLKFSWSLSPKTVGIALDRDVAAITAAGSLQMGSFNYLAFSQQGQQQTLSLSNSATVAAFAPRSHLVTGQAQVAAEAPTNPDTTGFFFKDAEHLEVQNDISLLFKTQLNWLRSMLERSAQKSMGGFGGKSQNTELLNSIAAIDGAFKSFEEAYTACVQDLNTGAINLANVQTMVMHYNSLQLNLMHTANQVDTKTQQLIQGMLRLVNSVGFAYIPHPDNFNAQLAKELRYNPLAVALNAQQSNTPINNQQLGMAWQQYYSVSGALTLTPQFNNDFGNYAIATPLSVENMRAYAYKIAHIKELTAAILQRDLYFSDQKMLERHLKTLLNYAEGPEIILSSLAHPRLVLLSAQSLHGFTLYKNQALLSADLSQMQVKTTSQNSTTKNRSHGRKSTAKTAVTASTINSTIGTAAISGSQDSLGTYLTAVADYIDSYLHRSAALTGQCTILVYNCGLMALPMALYQLLQNDPRFAKTAFKILILNDQVDNAKDFYKMFEAECFKIQEINTKADFIRRVQVEVLAETSSMSEYLDQHQLSSDAIKSFSSDGYSSMDIFSINRIQDPAALRLADICLLFHVFDAQASYEFNERDIVTVANDELHLEPNLIASSDISNANSSCSYITSKVQPLSKILYLNSMFYLTNDRLGVFTDTEQSLKTLVQDVLIKDRASEQAITITAPLYTRSLHTLPQGTKEVIQSALSYADVVLYFDALLSQNLLKSTDFVGVSYYKQLKDNKLNLMLASNSSNYHGKRNVSAVLTQALGAETSQEQVKALTDQLFQDAVSLSGSLVMHADLLASHSRDLISTVLASLIAERALAYLTPQLSSEVELCTSRFLLLEDYADLIGCKPEQLQRQMLCMQVLRYKDLAPLTDGDLDAQSKQRYLLILMVVESQFVAAADTKDLKNSLKQVSFTTDAFYRALKPHNKDITLDRKPLLALLAYMLGHGSDLQSNNQLSMFDSFSPFADVIPEVQKQLYQDDIDILIKGCSFACSYQQEANEVSSKLKDSKSVGRTSPKTIKESSSFPVMQLCIYRSMVQEILALYQSGNTQQLMEHLIQTSYDKALEKYFSQKNLNSIIEVRPQDLQSTPQARDSAVLQAATAAAITKLSQSRSKSTSTRSKKTTAKAAK